MDKNVRFIAQKLNSLHTLIRWEIIWKHSYLPKHKMKMFRPDNFLTYVVSTLQCILGSFSACFRYPVKARLWFIFLVRILLFRRPRIDHFQCCKVLPSSDRFLSSAIRQTSRTKKTYEVGTVGKISGYQPEGPGFNPRPVRGLNFRRPSFATLSVDRDVKPLV